LKFQDPTLLQQIVYLLTLIIGNNRFSEQIADKYESNDIQRTRTFSSSSLGSVSRHSARRSIKPSNQSPQLTRAFQFEPSEYNNSELKNPPSSFSFAWSVFSELMK
jgi:hypothetical protein